MSAMRCKAGSMLFASSIPYGGDIRPCTSAYKPIIGNILSNKLKEFSKEVACFKKHRVCTCDIHFQQGIVTGASDVEEFALIKNGEGRSCLANWEEWKKVRNLTTTNKFPAGQEIISQGGVKDDSILICDRNKVRARQKRTFYKTAVVNLILKARRNVIHH